MTYTDDEVVYIPPSDDEDNTPDSLTDCWVEEEPFLLMPSRMTAIGTTVDKWMK